VAQRGGQLHREDGPAVIRSSGIQEWWQNGQAHRMDGPAIVRPDGSNSWWKRGRILLGQGVCLPDLDHTTLVYLLEVWSPGDNVADLVSAIEAARH
jgi:hypothetical protein